MRYHTGLPFFRTVATICSASARGTRGSFFPCTTNSGFVILWALFTGAIFSMSSRIRGSPRVRWLGLQVKGEGRFAEARLTAVADDEGGAEHGAQGEGDDRADAGQGEGRDEDSAQVERVFGDLHPGDVLGEQQQCGCDHRREPPEATVGRPGDRV